MKHDHSEALEALAVKHGRNPLEVLELFNERAAVREYDGMYGRGDAERMAIGDVTEMLERAARPVDATRPHEQEIGTSSGVASDEVRHEGSRQPGCRSQP